MRKDYKVELKLLSPLHINAGVSGDGTRMSVRLDGKPYIPGTLFKGVTRSGFDALMNTFRRDDNKTEYFFGAGGFQRSRFIFGNLETEQTLVTEYRTNISISRYSRKNNDEAYVVTEAISPFDESGRPVVFIGEITAFYPKEEDAAFEKWLLEAISMIRCIGSGKSRGLGFVEVEVKPVEES